jgi:uncharacterized protein with NRDE domain
MCLILIAYRCHPRYELVFAGNRDEYYARPTAPLGFWDDAPAVLAGRDLEAGGTWFGISRTGRLAGVTNYRDPAAVNPNARSRGALVSNFLKSGEPARVFLEGLSAGTQVYNGFNLLVWDSTALCYLSNREGVGPRALQPGLYGLSNDLLNTPWPKVSKGKARLARLLGATDRLDPQAVLAVLQDRVQAPDAELPDTGVGLEWERALSPLFIETPAYGTRSSTAVLIERGGPARVMEKTWADGVVREFTLPWSSAPVG